MGVTEAASDSGFELETVVDVGTTALNCGVNADDDVFPSSLELVVATTVGVTCVVFVSCVFALELIRVLGFPSVNTSYSSFGSAWYSNSLLCSEHA